MDREIRPRWHAGRVPPEVCAMLVDPIVIAMMTADGTDARSVAALLRETATRLATSKPAAQAR